MAFILISAGIISGFWYVFDCIRTSELSANDPRLAKIVTVLCGFFFIGIFFAFFNKGFAHDGFLALLAAVGVMTFAVLNVQHCVPRTNPRLQLHQILDQVVANMIAGFGFRQSWQMMCQQLPMDQAAHYQKMLEHVVFSQQDLTSSTHHADRFVSELVRIDREPHRARQRMTELRDQFYMHAQFRRRSRQLTTQVRTQALVLVIFYIGLLILQLATRGWSSRLSLYFLISAALFVTGMIVLAWLVGRFKWKI